MAGHPQIVAGYYDSGDGSSSAASEAATMTPLVGFSGQMYTTWRGDYSQLEAYAQGAAAGR